MPILPLRGALRASKTLSRFFEPAVRYKRTLALTRRFAPRPSGALCASKSACRFVQASALTANILFAALRAALRFKIAPGDFVSRSATSPD
jgi:hypothetical protein